MNNYPVILIITLTTSFSYGQTQVRQITPPDISGIFILHWEESTKSITGEELLFGKRRKFEYQVFSSYPGTAFNIAKQTIVKGRYIQEGDTLKLTPTTKPTKFGPEIFNLRLKYLIRAIEVYSKDGKTRTITCLLDPKKPELFDDILELMPACINEFHANSYDNMPKMINAIGLETEILFYKERIFINH